MSATLTVYDTLLAAGLRPLAVTISGKFGMRRSGFVVSGSDAVAVVRHQIAGAELEPSYQARVEAYAEALRSAGFSVQWKIDTRKHHAPYLVVEV